jgi:transcriptional regulator with XRE-family HTH domain
VSQIDVSDIDTQIGAAIRSARMQAGMKQEQLATAIGIDRTTLSNYERGSRGIPVGVLVQIAYELRVPLSELVPRARTMEQAWAAPDSQISPDVQRITQTLTSRPDLAPQVAEFLTLLVERYKIEADGELLSP